MRIHACLTHGELSGALEAAAHLLDGCNVHSYVTGRKAFSWVRLALMVLGFYLWTGPDGWIHLCQTFVV